MALDPPQPLRALEHYDLAVAKRWQKDDLYFFRSEANYAVKKYNAALADLEVCLQMRPNYQKYLLSKAAIAYEKGDKELAYKTYYTVSELYDKQMPYYMLVVINIERERYIKAQEQIEDNLLRFERGKEFWTFHFRTRSRPRMAHFQRLPKSVESSGSIALLQTRSRPLPHQ